VIATQPDRAPRRHLQRFDEICHEAETLVHPLTMPPARAFEQFASDHAAAFW
jgi:hypothetical protein